MRIWNKSKMPWCTGFRIPFTNKRIAFSKYYNTRGPGEYSWDLMLVGDLDAHVLLPTVKMATKKLQRHQNDIEVRRAITDWQNGVYYDPIGYGSEFYADGEPYAAD